MRFRIFLKTGVEVLHLGCQHHQSDPWPASHWRENKGRWRLFVPAVEHYLDDHLAPKQFGQSVENFMVVLEIADFESWGPGTAFAPASGRVQYSTKDKGLRSVAQVDWQQVQHLSPRLQLEALRLAFDKAIRNVGMQKRKPRDFETSDFADEVSRLLRQARVTAFGRTRFLQSAPAFAAGAPA